MPDFPRLSTPEDVPWGKMTASRGSSHPKLSFYRFPVKRISLVVVFIVTVSAAFPSPGMARDADQVLDLWPATAPGETTSNPGEALPRRETEIPPATRITGITRPTLHLYLAKGESPRPLVLIFPGGGYKYVVVDKEGSEAADWLNSLGISAAVVRYRTLEPEPSQPTWVRPLQDGQRAVRLTRQHAKEWNIDPEKIGVLGFSAGGQAAAVVATRSESPGYEPIDAVDNHSCRPDFAMLLYPWNLVDKEGTLQEWVTASPATPPTLFIHTHDDGVSSLSSAVLYVALKQLKIPAELHIYSSGGHGYGLRPVENSDVDEWPQRAANWLRSRGLTDAKQGTEKE